ncbi:8414_t:CDS:2, partial [Scutellospora calospora]
SETIELEFSNDIKQIQENYSNIDISKIHDIYNTNKICSNNNSIQDIDDNSDSKNILKQKITEIVNSDNNFEIRKCSKNTVLEIIKIIDSNDDSSENQCYTLEKKKK